MSKLVYYFYFYKKYKNKSRHPKVSAAGCVSCKPCFVPNRAWQALFGGNHLSQILKISPRSSLQFVRSSAPTKVWVARSWGLPRSSLSISKKVRHCGTFTTIKPWFPLGHSLAVNHLHGCLALFFHLARTLLASQPVRAWTFLIP